MTGTCLQWPGLLSGPESSLSIVAWQHKRLAACRWTFPPEFCLLPQLLKKFLLPGALAGSLTPINILGSNCYHLFYALLSMLIPVGSHALSGISNSPSVCRSPCRLTAPSDGEDRVEGQTALLVASHRDPVGLETGEAV